MKQSTLYGIGALVLVVGAALYYLQDVLWLFFLAAIISYLLTPAVDFLQKLGLGRGLATLAILLFFMAVIAIAVMYLAPLLYHQAMAMIEQIPVWKAQLYSKLEPYIGQVSLEHWGDTLQHPEHLHQETATPLLQASQTVLGNVLNSGRLAIQKLGQMVLVLLLTFYMLKDWPVILRGIQDLLPKKIARQVTTQAREIDQVLSSYFHGQLQASLVTGLYYGTALTLLRMEYGFAFGFLVGVFSFIPYFTLAMGLTVGLILAYLNFGISLYFWLALAVFLLGQVVEGNVIAPVFVGKRLGMHPLTMLFAILVGSSLFGFFGLLIAVPTAAAIGVILKHFLDSYRQSAIYKGYTQ